MISNRIVIVGGGVIGLSIAYRLLELGIQPILLEKSHFYREASWAGAGRGGYAARGSFRGR